MPFELPNRSQNFLLFSFFLDLPKKKEGERKSEREKKKESKRERKRKKMRLIKIKFFTNVVKLVN